MSGGPGAGVLSVVALASGAGIAHVRNLFRKMEAPLAQDAMRTSKPAGLGHALKLASFPIGHRGSDLMLQAIHMLRGATEWSALPQEIRITRFVQGVCSRKTERVQEMVIVTIHIHLI